MKVLFITNIPSPYRVNFFNKLGKYVDLKVIFEAENYNELNKNWFSGSVKNFRAIFLKKGSIEEKKINWKILKEIKSYKSDIIVVTNYSYYTELIALLYIKIKKIPYLMEIDGGLIREESKFKYILKKFLISGAKAYISPSDSSDKYLEHYGANKKYIFRYPFTSLESKDILTSIISNEKKIEIREKLCINEKKVIISVGQFIHRKGFDILIESMKSISSSYGVYIIGDTPTEDYLRLKDKYKLNNLHFVQFKTKEELIEYYKSADLFVLATREDIWGLVINEAMAFGLPVITTEQCIAGIELIKNNENGYIIPINDEKELASKINHIIFDEELRLNISNNNIERIKEYTIENMVKRHVLIFNNILGEIL